MRLSLVNLLVAANTAVDGTLGNDSVDTGCASGNVLPDHAAVVAETELLLAVAHNRAVGGARWSGTTTSGGSRGSGRSGRLSG
jgi:hypothetical protein